MSRHGKCLRCLPLRGSKGYEYTTPSMGCEYSGVRGPPLLTQSEAIEGGCVYIFLSIHNPLYKGRAPLYAERGLSNHNPLYRGRGGTAKAQVSVSKREVLEFFLKYFSQIIKMAKIYWKQMLCLPLPFCSFHLVFLWRFQDFSKHLIIHWLALKS